MNLLNRTMTELRSEFPSMKRALFSSYHIGGCQSCAYSDEETLADVCKRNELDPQEVVKTVEESLARDAQMMLSPEEAQSLLAHNPEALLLDCRTREEFDAVKIEGATFLTQELQNSLFAPENYERTIILYDHTGQTALDTCSWFQGHGLKGTRIIKGGIDQWAQDVDTNIKRYRLELD